MSIHPEGTFGRLRYLLGGDRPSQTTRLVLSARQIHGMGVRNTLTREWYFTVASPSPTRKGSPAPTYPTHVSARFQARV
jgi:hypothetical protein